MAAKSSVMESDHPSFNDEPLVDKEEAIAAVPISWVPHDNNNNNGNNGGNNEINGHNDCTAIIIYQPKNEGVTSTSRKRKGRARKELQPEWAGNWRITETTRRDGRTDKTFHHISGQFSLRSFTTVENYELKRELPDKVKGKIERKKQKETIYEEQEIRGILGEEENEEIEKMDINLKDFFAEARYNMDHQSDNK